MTDISQNQKLTRDDVYLVGRTNKHSMSSECSYNFGPVLEIYAVPKTKEMKEHLYHATDPNFVLDRSNNPFAENTVDYFTFKDSKPVLTAGNQVWLYANWKDSDNLLERKWIRESIDFHEGEKSWRQHTLPKSIAYALTINGEANEETTYGPPYDLCYDPEESNFLESIGFGYTHLPLNYDVNGFYVDINCREGIDLIDFNKQHHPFGFYKMYVWDGCACFFRNESLNRPGAGFIQVIGDDELPQDELTPQMRKVNEYLRNLPAFCEHLGLPDFSRMVRKKPKIVDDLNAHLHLDALIIDDKISPEHEDVFKKLVLR